jgi:predicted small integral membrane protein
MYDQKIILGVAGSILLLTGDFFYLRGVLQRHTRPHAFSWLTWSTLNIIAFAALVSEGAGAGAWVTAANATSCLIIFAFAITRGDRRFLAFDWLSLLAAGISLALWALTKDPLLSIVLIVLVDIFGCLPTFRKSYSRPWEEKVISYTCAAFANLIAILALESYSVTTWLYPGSIIFLDGLLTALILIRRKQLAT